MTRTVTGIHWSNEGYSQDWPDMLKIAGPTGSIVMLDLALSHYKDIRQMAGPELLIGLRFYTERWHLLEPEGWAAECLRRLQEQQPAILADPYVCLSPANEQDLASEGHPDAASGSHPNVSETLYTHIWDWQVRWVHEMRRLAPGMACKLGTAPLAGGHDMPGYPPDYEYQLPGFKTLARITDCLWIHAYTQGAWGDTPEHNGYWYGLRPLRPAGYREDVQGKESISNLRDPGGVISQYPEQVYFLAETGTGRHSNTSIASETVSQFRQLFSAYSACKRVAGSAIFIWNSGPEHGGNRIWPNWNLIRDLQNMERFPAAAWPPQAGEEPIMWDRHSIYDHWQKIFGGQGYNPADAFGKLIADNPDKQFGAFVGPYQLEEPFIYAFTTVGIFVYDKRNDTAVFATSEEGLPLA